MPILNPDNTSVPISRYGISKDDLRQAALSLQLGDGIADRFKSIEATAFVEKAEDWAETQVEEFIAVPLKPVRAPGQKKQDFNPEVPTKRNYPQDFIYSIIYYATGLLLHSEYFENAPNLSEAGNWALNMAASYIINLKDRRTFRVGAGRMRYNNPMVPPSIAPRLKPEQNNQMFGNK